MSLGSDLDKLLACSWTGRLLLLEAFLWLGIMRAGILFLPFRKIVRVLRLKEGGVVKSDTTVVPDVAPMVGWAVRAAAARTPWESACLGQSLAGAAMLRRRGIAGVLTLGVAKDAAGRDLIAAHAWLSCGDTILTGAEGHNRYSVISSFSWYDNSIDTSPRQ